MPTFDGQKVACMACIRGHRSSKCNHTDRLMIAVRKPGRPLSSCPHLPGTRCGCSNVLAALPRQPKCGCSKPDDDSNSTKDNTLVNEGSSSTDTSSTGNGSINGTSSSNGSVSTKASSCCADNTNNQPIDEKVELQKPSDSPPVSPTTRTSSRVEKKTSRKPTTQKQALNTAKLERMDTNSLHMMPPMSTKNRQESVSIAPQVSVPLFTDSYQQAGNGSFAPNEDYQTSPIQTWHSMPELSVNAEDIAGSMPLQSPNGTQTGSSCCSGKPGRIQDASASNIGSAFQGMSSHPQLQPQTHVQAASHQAWSPATYNPNFPINGGSILVPNQPVTYGVQQHTPYYNQVAVQSYSPIWGSIAHPLHPAQYQQFMNNSTQGGLQNSYPISQSPMDLNANATVPFTDHDCSCGKGCQCLGCPSHPYNEPTQEFIWDAMKLQFEEEPKKGRAGSIVETNNTRSNNDQLTSLDETSPAVSNTPSDTASPRDQGAENFIFVSYPPPPGAAMQDTCPCGPSCECIDCVIHRSLDN